MNVYGIKTCGSVRKALAFFKEHNIEHTFIDLKKEPVDRAKIEYWLKDVELSKLLNNKGTTYRNLKLKDLNLDDEGKIEWLAKENMLIKRPVLEMSDKSYVGFDEKTYEEMFL